MPVSRVTGLFRAFDQPRDRPTPPPWATTRSCRNGRSICRPTSRRSADSRAPTLQQWCREHSRNHDARARARIVIAHHRASRRRRGQHQRAGRQPALRLGTDCRRRQLRVAARGVSLAPGRLSTFAGCGTTNCRCSSPSTATGGEIDLAARALGGELMIGDDVRLLATGGASLSAAGTVTGGRGGSIGLRAARRRRHGDWRPGRAVRIRRGRRARRQLRARSAAPGNRRRRVMGSFAAARSRRGRYRVS